MNESRGLKNMNDGVNCRVGIKQIKGASIENKAEELFCNLLFVHIIGILFMALRADCYEETFINCVRRVIEGVHDRICSFIDIMMNKNYIKGGVDCDKSS